MQEGLFNAIRHAKAMRIELEVREDRVTGSVDIVVRDDGRGLVTPTRPGLGLAGMHERVQALEGRFDLSTSGAGTTLAISLPIESPAPAAVARAAG